MLKRSVAAIKPLHFFFDLDGKIGADISAPYHCHNTKGIIIMSEMTVPVYFKSKEEGNNRKEL